MSKKIHVFGAAGSGTSTLGTSLSKILPHTHFDTDDYFWITKFTEQRAVPEKREMLRCDLFRELFVAGVTALNPILIWLSF